MADAIKPSEIDGWLSAKTDVPATANRYKATISLIYREAIRNGKTGSNPARLVKQRREANARSRFLKPEEENRLRNAINERCPERLPELAISLNTGMRLSEQYQLQWEQVGFERKEIKLQDTKNGTSRIIPMNTQVVAAFELLWKDTKDHGPQDRVFAINRPRKWFAAVCKAAKLTDYRWHDNRHTFCSRLAESGANVYTIMRLAGHKTIGMSARYTHMSDGTLAAAVARIN